jgi:hypothetical protein
LSIYTIKAQKTKTGCLYKQTAAKKANEDIYKLMISTNYYGYHKSKGEKKG